MKCPTCGTENDAANRFCDQCGSRLNQGGATVQSQQAALDSQPTAAAATCPSCGAVVLPGEAFCDECGAALGGAAPTAGASSYDAPTVYAPPTPSRAPSGNSQQGPVCQACGHQNLPGDRFCDNCGAALTASASGGPPAGDEPKEPPPPREAPPSQPPQPKGEPPAPSPAPVKTASADLPTAEQPALSADAAYGAEKQRLEDEIARQQQIIAQFEQMQAMFGAAAPPAVTQGLAEARDALARAQAELDNLQPPAPPVDPAEVQRLEDEIARQQQIIAQFEQMQAMFGAAAPPAVTQGLAEARDALARAQAELSALGGGAAASPPAQMPSAPQAQATAEAPVAPADVPAQIAPPPAPEPVAAPPAPEPVIQAPAPEPVVPPPAPMPATAPRLVLDESGRELALPADKAEIIVGREDPISGIFPEVDLTPFGGEGGGVSRQHARISHADGQWTITDLNSTNYTRVDGNKLDPSLPVSIRDGSRIVFGRIAVTFRE
jgi:pSer/pThr/pTyr-binding forkhead associated (FHA) protein/predicted amidophosphoribosyltransferase